MASIIIPACNEAHSISCCIQNLVGQIQQGDEILVIPNGCSDNTAIISKAFEPLIIVLESDQPSKVGALNLGDSIATSFPRIYADADIIFAPGSIEKIKAALSQGGKLAVSPDPVMDLSQSSWAVKAYYDIWLSMPYCRQGMMGAGVYALSEEGRKRFDQFPDVIADDGYVRALFKEHERGKVEGAYVTVKAPASLKWLMKIKTRSRLGQMQLAMRYPDLIKNEAKDYSGGILQVLKNPLNWPKVAIYLYVTILSRILAKQKLKNIAGYRWEQDLASRQTVASEESRM